MVFKNLFKKILFPALFLAFLTSYAYSQKMGFISSDLIRDKFPEAKLADQRINSFVEEWKRELSAMDKHIEDLEHEIQKNRLVWSEQEKMAKQQQLEDAKRERMTYARNKFETGGEYEGLVEAILQPVEKKIYAAVQEVASDEGVDFVFDKSLQPMPYTNYKYDLTLKVLRKLGVDVDELEKDLQDKISSDPRNKKADTKKPPSRRRRSRRISTSEEQQEERGGASEEQEPAPAGEGEEPDPSKPGFMKPPNEPPPDEEPPDGYSF